MLDDAFTSNALEQIKRYSQIAQDLNSTPQHHAPGPAHHLPHHHHPAAAAAAALPLGPPPLQALAPLATAAAAAAAAASAAPTPAQLASALLARLDAFEVRVNAHDYNVVRRQRLAEMSSEVQAVQHQLEADLLLATDEVLQQQEAQDTVANVRTRLHQATEDKHEGLRDVTAHFRDGSAAFLGALEVCGGGVNGGDAEPTLAVFEAEVRRIEASMDAVKGRQEESVQVMQAELWRLHKAVEETREGRKASEAEFMKLVEVVVGKLTAELKEEKEKRVALFRTLRAELKRRNIAGRIRGGGGVASALAASTSASATQGSRRNRHQHRGVSPPRHARARQPQRRDVSPPAQGDEEQASPTPATLRLPPASIFTHLFQTPQPAPPLAAAPAGEWGTHGLARARPLSQLSQNTLATAPRGALKGWKPSESAGQQQQQQSRRPSVGVRVDARDAADKPKWK